MDCRSICSLICYLPNSMNLSINSCLPYFSPQIGIDRDTPPQVARSFPNGTPEAPLFPMDSARLLLAELLWDNDIIDEECRIREMHLKTDLPVLTEEEISRVENALSEEITLTDRSEKI